LEIKNIIKNKNIILSINNKLNKLVKDIKDKERSDSSFLDFCGEFVSTILLVVSVSFFYYLISFLNVSSGANLLLSIILGIGLFPAIYVMYMLNSYRKIKKEFKSKGSYIRKIHDFLTKRTINSFSKEELLSITKDFSEEEINFIELKDNKNLIHIDKNKFKKEIYSYIKTNKVSKSEYEDILQISKHFDLDLDKEKIESFYELSILKNINEKKVSNNLIIKSI
jgi:hypothetical protein